MSKIIFSVLCVATIVFAAPVYARSLAEVAQDRQLDNAARIAALAELRGTDFDAYVDVLGELLNSSDVELAKYSAGALVNLVVMVGGPGLTADVLDVDVDGPRRDLAGQRGIFEILGENVLNPNPYVREVIVPFLVGFGDEKAFFAVVEAEISGEIGSEEALGYYLAAPSHIGNPYLRRFAEGEHETLAARAISVLASDLEEQLYVRNEILLNSGFSMERRFVALTELANHDPNFPDYVMAPGVLELALSIPHVPGSNPRGENLIREVVAAKLSKDPEILDKYLRDLEEMSLSLEDIEIDPIFRHFFDEMFNLLVEPNSIPNRTKLN